MNKMNYQKRNCRYRQQNIFPPKSYKKVVQGRHKHYKKHHYKNALPTAEINSPTDKIQQQNSD